ncbi:polyprenyl synthetase family protein [Brassicibacter mesophilus]|uniref:polyprenyl synthetase family protein n=1 Tax=Brassicibacter mesophilus TaxID=745119 RepID=UPI003D1C8304
MKLNQEMHKYKIIVDQELDRILPKDDSPQNRVYEAMRYSIFAGGKRLRPIITLKASELVCGDYKPALPIAAAIEMIHTYSLIHDDLPAMDNDDYRRGKLTNHKIYGDAIAILAGDGLLNFAFETMINGIEHCMTKYDGYINAIKEVGRASGVFGMIGGQTADILSDNNALNEQLLSFIHQNKTAALIEASIVAGGLAAGGTDDQVKRLREYGKAIGLSYQIRDDILDRIGDKDKLGKNTGSDEANNKFTYLTLYGLERAIEKTKELCNDAINSLSIFNEKNTNFFISLSHYLTYREN